MKSKVYAAAVGVAMAGAAQAQSVTLYGLVDAGVTYTNNVGTGSGHSSLVQLTSGSSQGDRWGLKGSEDLGGGNKAIFTLENGFQLSNGQLGQGGLEFGRQAFVGLSSTTAGTVTIGRQYDFIGDFMPAFAIGANTPAGLLAWSLPANAAGGYVLDNRMWGDEINSSVKYISPTWAGLTFGALYGFGNAPGSLARNSSSNLYLGYENGPFSAAVSWLGIRNASTTSGNSNEFAIGAAYIIGPLRVLGNVTDVQLSAGTQARAVTYELGATYSLTPAFVIGGGFQYQQRNNDVGNAHQFTLSGDYLLSKRTDVYVVGALGHDSGYDAIAQAALGEAASGASQLALRVGMRHRF